MPLRPRRPKTSLDSPRPPPKGQIHVKLIQAKSLSVKSSLYSRPYVVVQFEQNEFVSRDPIPESDKEIKGTPTNLALPPGDPPPAVPSPPSMTSDTPMPTALPQKRERKHWPNTNHPPASSSPTRSSGLLGLFGRLNAHNPVWKHEVSLSVFSLFFLLSCSSPSQRCHLQRLTDHLHRLRPFRRESGLSWQNTTQTRSRTRSHRRPMVSVRSFLIFPNFPLFIPLQTTPNRIRKYHRIPPHPDHLHSLYPKTPSSLNSPLILPIPQTHRSGHLWKSFPGPQKGHSPHLRHESPLQKRDHPQKRSRTHHRREKDHLVDPGRGHPLSLSWSA
jgi:hypothetical protein